MKQKNSFAHNYLISDLFCLIVNFNFNIVNKLIIFSRLICRDSDIEMNVQYTLSIMRNKAKILNITVKIDTQNIFMYTDRPCYLYIDAFVLRYADNTHFKDTLLCL